jgi:hypothetical protein
MSPIWFIHQTAVAAMPPGQWSGLFVVPNPFTLKIGRAKTRFFLPSTRAGPGADAGS